MRGHCLGTQWSMRRQLDRELASIELSLLHLESASISDPAAKNELSKARTKHAELMESLRCLNYKAHTAKTQAQADRSGSLLAWLVRQEHPRHPV